MTISLQDQLKQAGLVDDKKAKQLARAKRKEEKLVNNTAGGKPGKKNKHKQKTQNELAIEKARAEKIARDKQLNKEKTEKAQQFALAAQVKQLVEQNQIPRDGGEEKYHFTENNKIKHIWVSDKQVQHLRKRLIGIVKLAEDYVLVPLAVAEKIRQRDTVTFIFTAEESTEELSSEDAEYYAQFKIPDDLDW